MNDPDPINSNASDPMAVDDDLELLTAYLDGELDDTAVANVRARLVADEGFRESLRQLQSAWDYLDELPYTPCDENFTQSTLELVVARHHQLSESGAAIAKVVNSAEGTQSNKSTKRRFGFLPILLSFLTVAGALGIGHLIGRSTSFGKHIAVLRKLTTIRDLPGLRLADDIDFARQLSQIPNLELLAFEKYSDRILPELPKLIENRTIWRDNLSPEQQSVLYRNSQDAEKLSPEEWRKVTELDKKIDAEPDASKLRLSLGVAAAILESRTSAERAAFSSLKSDEKYAELARTIHFELAQLHSARLSKTDRAILEDWCGDLVAEYPRMYNSRFRSISDAAFVLLVFNLRESVPMELFEQLLEQLSGQQDSDSAALLSNIRPEDRNMILASWITAGENPLLPPDEKLMEAYEIVPLKDRESIEMLPSREAKQALSRASRNQPDNDR